MIQCFASQRVVDERNTPMVQERHQKILIVEDDLDLAEMLNAYFSVQGYQVTTLAWGKEAVNQALDDPPALVILDIHLPDIDGFEVCRRLRESHITRNVPILFLTERSERGDRLHGLEMGVVDYITKPFDIQELRLRVRNVLRRVESSTTENPVTSLPEGETINDVLQSLLNQEQKDWGILAVRLLGLDSYRELYGFIASDDVLRVLSLIINTAVQEVGGKDTFCGHMDQETFLMIVPAPKLNTLQERIQERAEQSLEYFYPSSNRGDKAHTENRLRLVVQCMTEKDAAFENVDELRDNLLGRLAE
jgi:PleD family two-component response regulator